MWGASGWGSDGWGRGLASIPERGEAQAGGELQEEASTAQAQPGARVDLGGALHSPHSLSLPGLWRERDIPTQPWNKGAPRSIQVSSFLVRRSF